MRQLETTPVSSCSKETHAKSSLSYYCLSVFVRERRFAFVVRQCSCRFRQNTTCPAYGFSNNSSPLVDANCQPRPCSRRRQSLATAESFGHCSTKPARSHGFSAGKHDRQR